MKNFEIKKDKRALMAHMGDISQIAGLKQYRLSGGKADGVEAVDFKTGSGLEFTVLPGRCLDIAWASFKSVPVAYMSKTGITAPAYYENEGINWLRGFFAGLLTTCGLSNVGGPESSEDSFLGKIEHGLHGRIGNTRADNVSVKEEWVGNELKMSVSGRMREAMFHAENMILRRDISSKLGENKIYLNDTIENEGFMEQPLMILYHINIGYPLLAEGSRLICNPKSTRCKNLFAENDIDNFQIIHEPKHGIEEKVYFHDLPSSDKGTSLVGIVNEKLELGIYIKFNKEQLPEFTQWKMLREVEYVMGLEPGNCIPQGRTEQKKRGRLEVLKPGEKKKIDIEIGILANLIEIQKLEKSVAELS